MLFIPAHRKSSRFHSLWRYLACKAYAAGDACTQAGWYLLSVQNISGVITKASRKKLKHCVVEGERDGSTVQTKKKMFGIERGGFKIFDRGCPFWGH